MKKLATAQTPIARVSRAEHHYNSNNTYLCRRCRLTIELRSDDRWYDFKGGDQCWNGSTREPHSPWE